MLAVVRVVLRFVPLETAGSIISQWPTKSLKYSVVRFSGRCSSKPGVPLASKTAITLGVLAVCAAWLPSDLVVATMEAE